MLIFNLPMFSDMIYSDWSQINLIYLLTRNSNIPKGQTEIVKQEDRQDHGEQNETKDKHRIYNTTLRTKAGVTQILQKPG